MEQNKTLLVIQRKDPLEIPGDHALTCRHGFDVVPRYGKLRKTIPRSVIKEARLEYSLEPSLLCRVEILAHPPPLDPGITLNKPAAYNATVSHPFTTAVILSILSAAARIADDDEAEQGSQNE